jgi:hypothetical protein
MSRDDDLSHALPPPSRLAGWRSFALLAFAIAFAGAYEALLLTASPAEAAEAAEAAAAGLPQLVVA